MRTNRLTIVIVILIFIGIAPHPAWGVESIIRVGGDHQYPPYEFVDEAGNYRGFNVDIMHAIALDQGFTPEFVPMTWDEAQQALIDNRIDVIQGMTYSERRAKIYSFCHPTLTNAQAIFVPRNNYTVTGLGDLQGLKVGVEQGDISIELLSEYPGIFIRQYKTQDEAMQALIKGEINAFVGNELTGWYLLEKWRHLEEFKMAGEPLRPTQYGPVVRKGNEEIAAMINRGLTNIKANGTYDKIYRKWFGHTRISNTRYLRIGGALLLLALFLLLIFYYLNQRLKDEVERRTEQLRAYARTQRVILDNNPSGLIIVNLQGIIEDSNPAGDTLLGQAIVGTPVFENPLLDFLTPELIAEIISSKSTVEREIEQNNQSYLVKISYLDDTNDRLLINISDITAQKRMERQRYEEAKSRALSTLVAGLAHEIRNPLTSIKTFVELIPSKIGNSRFQQRLVEVLPHELGRIEYLVQELLEYARHREAEPQNCPLDITLAPVIDLLAVECESKGIELTVNLQGSVFCDQRHLVQIVLNLVLNSLKAVAPGGKIAIYSELGNHENCITVADTGHGIPAEYHSQLFDPFFSLQGGTGMGLALVAQMVKENRGRINFKSTEGQGTIFNIWLPTKQSEVPNET